MFFFKKFFYIWSRKWFFIVIPTQNEVLPDTILSEKKQHKYSIHPFSPKVMKKNTLFTNTLLSLVFILVATLTFAQTTVFDANFINALGNNAWTSGSTGSGAGGWTNGAVATHATGATGNYIYTNLYTASNVYNGNTISSITSPVVNLTNYTNLILTFNVWFNTEAFWDGANIEYSTDGGGSWGVLGTVGSGFYTDIEVNSLGIDVIGWSGNSNGWTAKTINLSSTDINFDNNSNVRFRIKFASDGSVAAPGIAIDNFKIVGTPITLLPEIDIQGNGVSIADGDTTPLLADFTMFPAISINTSTTRTYVIRNTGPGTLTVGTYSITGANASSFTVTTPPPTNIIAGGSANIVITFLPTFAGVHNANITMYNSDTNENPYDFSFQGTATDSEIDVYYVTPIPAIPVVINPIPDNTYSVSVATGTDFGNTTVGVPVMRTFTIKNEGTLPLILTDTPMVKIIGVSAVLFAVTQPAVSSVPAGGTTTFTITFTPLIVGNYVCILSILSNDSNETKYDFTIQGNCVVSGGSEIDVQGNAVSIPDGDTTPSTLDYTDFGNTFVGVPITVPFLVYNWGSSNLTLSGNTFSPLAPNFAITNMVSGTVTSGLVTSFNITFTPTAVGTFTASVVLANSDSNEGPYNFNVRVTVIAAPALTVAPGGVTTNLKLWLKADREIGTIPNNAIVSTWVDRAFGNTRNATAKTSLEPIFLNNATDNVNFNPVIRFDGRASLYGGQGFNNHDVFIALKTGIVTRNSNSSSVFCGDDVATNPNGASNQDITGFSLGSQTSRFNNEVLSYNQGSRNFYGEAEVDLALQPKSYSGANIYNPRKRILGAGGFMDIFHNGLKLTTTNITLVANSNTTYKDIRNTKYFIGRNEFYDSDLIGDVLEIITYDSRNTDADRRKVETYLALKYGITLGVNTTSLNYVNSDGTVIYSEAAGYNTNIAGIGRDDKSELNQKQSKTEYTADDVTMGLSTIAATNSANSNTFAADKRFLIWGHNNAVLTQTPPVIVDLSSDIAPTFASKVDFIGINRVWRVVESGGDVGSVKVSVPKAVIAATINPPGDFLMFISDSPVFSPAAEYRIMNLVGENLEANYDFNGTKYITFGYAAERRYVRSIDFNGTNDYLDGGNVLNLTNNFTVSAWVKPAISANMSILSKRNNPFTQGYDLSLNTSRQVVMSWMNGAAVQTITSLTSLPNNIWHNVAVIYNGTNAKMYIDGVLDRTVNLSVPTSSNDSFLVAAANGSALVPTAYFRGTIDEIRIWDVALTESQMRYVINQEIQIFGSATTGRIIPSTITKNDIRTIPWTNLKAYYTMSRYTYTNTKDESASNFTLALKNLNSVDRQTAPLPYESNSNGTWQTPLTWLNNTVQDLPNSLSIVDNVTPVNWNIVRTTHNVTSTGNKTVLGLMVNSQTLTASSDTKIEVTNYLKLDGKIDLVGMSQLVQTLDSDLDVTSAGSIERDQRGQANFYNYNYWCSPVSPINAIANNTNYTVGGVMKDGTLSTPANINWIAGHTPLVTIPISISRFWLYKFDNYANSYSNWAKITENSTLRVGQGFTMKGSGTEGNQNYTFVGKPNNGLINSNTVLSDQLTLIGNPYPSAMDAEAFITDNAGSIDRATDGTLYFWEHYLTNNTHVLKEYQGGYGVKNLVGGVAPVSTDVDFISQSGATSKSTPKRYIPVGQGFFVNGRIGTGGTIIFNNNQRAFFKETDAVNSNPLYKQRPSASNPAKIDHWNNNSDDIAPKNISKKLRLGFSSSNKYHRQVLLGFMNEKATNEMDYGYDAISLDDIPNDMYFLNGENQLVIQGEGYFDENASYPIGVKTAVEGKITFTIDAIENIDSQQKIYIYDDETKIYNEIQKNSFEVNMPVGINNSRFSLRFKDKSSSTDKTLSVVENNTNTDGIKIAHIQNNNTLKITNNSKETTVEKVTLFNINGQTIASWKIENQDQQNIQIQINTISSGVYVAKLKTSIGELSKKLIIK